MSLSSYNNVTDKQITLKNGDIVWICDYKDNVSYLPQVSEVEKSIKAKIFGEGNIKLGFYRTYTVEFENDSSSVDWHDIEFKWDFICAFDINEINIDVVDNRIRLYVEDSELLDEKIKICVVVENNIVAVKVVNIR